MYLCALLPLTRSLFILIDSHQHTYICHVERGPVDKIPGGPNIKVFLGVTVMVGLCAIPVFSKPNEKRGHDLFSQEKPEAVVASTERLQREHYKKNR